jgi:hypothetical protein
LRRVRKALGRIKKAPSRVRKAYRRAAETPQQGVKPCVATEKTVAEPGMGHENRNKHLARAAKACVASRRPWAATGKLLAVVTMACVASGKPWVASAAACGLFRRASGSASAPCASRMPAAVRPSGAAGIVARVSETRTGVSEAGTWVSGANSRVPAVLAAGTAAISWPLQLPKEVPGRNAAARRRSGRAGRHRLSLASKGMLTRRASSEKHFHAAWAAAGPLLRQVLT